MGKQCGNRKVLVGKSNKCREKGHWTKIRCGNVGKAGNKGYKDSTCGLCGLTDHFH